MASPPAYSELGLAAYMAVILGDTALALGWTAETEQLTEAVNDTLAVYGVRSIVSATDIPKLRAIARWQAWRAVVDSVASRSSWSADGQSVSDGDWQARALRSLSLAEADAGAFGVATSQSVRVDRIAWVHDPYVYVPEEARTLP